MFWRKREKTIKPIPADERLFVSRRLPLAIAVLTVPVLPMLLEVPLWVGPAFAASCGWRLLADRRKWPLPGGWVLAIITFLAIAAIAGTFRTLNGMEAGIPFLILIMGLKVLESKRLRDLYVLVLMSWFMLAAGLLLSQSMLATLYAFSGLVLVTAALLILSAGQRSLPTPEAVKTAGIYLGQALPIALIAFVLFPRLNGPLWALPSANDTMSGLTDTMEPGSIGELSQSGAVAFRVRFEGQPPPKDQLYWRGPVMQNFDGRLWSTSETASSYKLHPQDIQYEGGLTNYTVILEPHGAHWIYGLEMPVSQTMPKVLGRRTQIATDFHLRSANAVTERIRYSMSSMTEFTVQPRLSPQIMHGNLLLPDDAAVQARELANRWRSESNNPREVVERALQHFRQEPFVYTLKPGELQGDPVDQFLFETRRGFCGHYAGAFVVLMRAAGIPARVVTGYMGGEMNDDYMIVRQLDAHAWAEVWLAGEGWLRVDPTAAVAPSRIESGVADAVDELTDLPTIAVREPGMVRELRLRLDALQNSWNEFVLGYGPETQKAFLEAISPWLANWRNMLLTLMIVAIAFFGGLTALMLWRDRRDIDDPLQLIWLAFCRKLARKGTRRAPGEGPEEFLQRAIVRHPAQADAIKKIIEGYIALRYAAQPGEAKALRRAVKQLRLARYRPA